MAPPAIPKTPLKILMLHGYTQSGPLYRSKTRALEKALSKSLPAYTLQLVYPTAPHLLLPADSPSYFSSSTRPFETNSTDTTAARSDLEGESSVEEPPSAAPAVESWGWYTRDAEGGYVGFEEGLETIAKAILEEGPFDGVIGFSQGAALAVMVGSLLEGGRREDFKNGVEKGWMEPPEAFVAKHGRAIQGPVKFVVSYSGFRAQEERYGGFYEPKVRTRTLCVRGSLDTVVGEERAEGLREVLGDGEELVHLGGHFVPSGKRELAAVCGFVKDALERVRGEAESK